MAGDKEQVLFERIYAERHERGSWPRMTDLQRKLASEHIDVNVRVTVQASEGRAMLDSSNETVSLNLGGLARVPAARELLEAYVASLQKMLERYRDVGSAPRFTSEDLDVPRLDAKTKDELSELIVREHWGLGSNEGGGEDWSYEITDQVLSAEGVETIADLLAARFGGPTAEAKQEPGREEAWVATLPDHARPRRGRLGRPADREPARGPPLPRGLRQGPCSSGARAGQGGGIRHGSRGSLGDRQDLAAQPDGRGARI
jgi:hypothetical protein